MSRNYFAIFLILMILFSMFPVQAAPDIYTPIITSDPSLSALVFSTGDTSTMDVWVTDGRLHVSDSEHTMKDLRVLESMLYNRVDGYNGKEVMLSHINDAGVKDSSKMVSVHSEGIWTYFYDVEFSEVIIDGFVGTWQVTQYNLSVSDSLNLGQEANGSTAEYVRVNITPATTETSKYDYIASLNPVGWWKGDGNANDSAGYGNHGTLNGDANTSVNLKYNNCFGLDGVGDSVVIDDTPILNFGATSDFTVSFWLNTTGTYWEAVTKGTSAAGWRITYQFSQLKVIIEDSVSNSTTHTVTTPLGNDGHRHFWTIVFDRDGYITSYVDGNIIGTPTDITNIGNINNSIDVGIGKASPNWYLKGNIDDIQIYNRILSQTEINNLYYDHLQQLKIKTNSNSTYSTEWISTADNPISAVFGAGEFFNLLNFTVPETVIIDNVTIRDYPSTVKPFDAVATIGYTEDITKITESAAAGTYTLNITHAAGNTGEGYINYTTINSVLLDADFWNDAVLSTDNPNATLSSTLPDFSINTGYVSSATEFYYLIEQDYFYPPTNLVGINGTDNIILNWDDMPNSDNYSVYQDDVFLINVTASNYTITGLPSATEYNISVTTWNGSQQTSKASTIITTDALPTTSASGTIGSTARGLISSDNETLIIGDSNAKYTINITGLFNIIFDKTNPNNLITKIIEWLRSTLNSIQVHSPGTPQERSTFWTIVLFFGIILLISGITDKNPKIQPVPAALFGFFISVISVFYLGLFSIVI